MQLFGQKNHLLTRENQLQLIDECKKGDRRAQKALYDALAPKMYAVCLRYVGNSELAEDILQDGFVTLFTKLGSYLGEGSFEGWARKIFVNTALMSLRKNDVLKQSEDVDAAWNITAPDPSALDRISHSELLKLVSELPDGFRTVFNMFIIEGYSHKEIAASLGISEATSRSQLLRARALLQDKIKKLIDADK
ncbi:MAG: sigma-70 family RNA polymerase sigma factor [Bacteroidales bacterium]|nr:sigma-70 family RNA polymerase sigma factor [Bacteroidales bacterium]